MKKEPCPHCLRRKNICEQQRSKYEWYYRCTNCGLSGPIEVTKEDAIAAWNALPRREEKDIYQPLSFHPGLPRRLRWTKEKPTTPDFYWYRSEGGSVEIGIVYADVIGNLCVHFAGEEDPNLLELVVGEWAGPIPEPEE